MKTPKFLTNIKNCDIIRAWKGGVIMLSATQFKIWCKSQGFTASDVAEKLGVSKSSVYKYWQNVSKPSRKIEKKIVEVFNIDTNEMFNF